MVDTNEDDFIMSPYKWQIDLWENENGVTYAERDLLGKLANRERSLFQKLAVKERFLTSNFTVEELPSDVLEFVGGGLVELKFSLPKCEIRFLGTIDYSTEVPTLYVFCAFKKKNNRIRKQYLETARSRFAEFKLVQGYL